MTMDWRPIATITPDAGHVLFYGTTRHDDGVAFTGWIARNGRIYGDRDGLAVYPTHWCQIVSPHAGTDPD